MHNANLEILEHSLTYLHSFILTTMPHFHKELEIVYVKKGTALCYADDQVYNINEGNMFIAFPYQIHHYTHSKNGEYHIFIFSADLLYNISDMVLNNLPDNNVMNVDKNPACLKLINDFINEDGPFRETLRVGILNQLLPVFLTQTELHNKIETNSATLKQILDYCDQHYASTITLDDMAKTLHFSKFYISNLMNNKLNISFNRYINSLRINKAIHLMNDENKKLAYIAQEVGFGSIRSFNRAFMQIMNITPSSYIKLIRNQKTQNGF